MKPTFFVLTDLSSPAQRAAHFAALLASAVEGQLVLIFEEHEPLFEPEIGLVTLPEEYYTQQRLDTDAAMQELAALLPVPTTVVNDGGFLPPRLHEHIEQWQPQLLVMALAPERDVLDELLANQALPMLRNTGLPLLLVPDGTAQDPSLPKMVAVAADDENFRLNSASLALKPLLTSWQAAYCVLHVEAPDAPDHTSLHQAETHVHCSGLLPAGHWVTYDVQNAERSAGIVQAALDVQADVLVLLARPRTFVGSVFGLGVVSEVARRCPVPLLVLPTVEPPPAAQVKTHHYAGRHPH